MNLRTQVGKILSTSFLCVVRDQKSKKNTTNLHNRIYNLLLNNKFKRWAVADSYKVKILKTIKICIKKNLPIHFTYPFGGYKLWRLDSAPYVDWAEFFSISYIIRRLFIISLIYKPGFNIEFISENYFTHKITYISMSDLKKYRDSFKELILYFRKIIPKNIQISYKDISDLVSLNIIKNFVYSNKEKFTNILETSSKSYQLKRIQMAKLNINLNNLFHDKKFSKKKYLLTIKKSIILHETYLTCPERNNYLNNDSVIMLFNDPILNCIPIGSNKVSRVKFWTGKGVLEHRGNGFIDRILSINQLEKIDSFKKKSINLSFLKIKGNNFNKIIVYSQKIDF